MNYFNPVSRSKARTVVTAEYAIFIMKKFFLLKLTRILIIARFLLCVTCLKVSILRFFKRIFVTVCPQWHWQLVAGFSAQRLGLALMAVRVVFNVTMGQVSVRVFRFFRQYHSTAAPYSLVTSRKCTMGPLAAAFPRMHSLIPRHQKEEKRTILLLETYELLKDEYITFTDFN